MNDPKEPDADDRTAKVKVKLKGTPGQVQKAMGKLANGGLNRVFEPR